MMLTSANEHELARMLPREVMSYLRSLQKSPSKDVEVNFEDLSSARHTPMTKLLPQTLYSQPHQTSDILKLNKNRDSP
jgi:hypothetical protein